MCGRSKKSLLRCGITIWGLGKLHSKEHFVLPDVSFKLTAVVLPVWKTNYPQPTCSANHQPYV